MTDLIGPIPAYSQILFLYIFIGLAADSTKFAGRIPLRRLDNLTNFPTFWQLLAPFWLDLTPVWYLLLRSTKFDKVKSRQSGPLQNRQSFIFWIISGNVVAAWQRNLKPKNSVLSKPVFTPPPNTAVVIVRLELSSCGPRKTTGQFFMTPSLPEDHFFLENRWNMV